MSDPNTIVISAIGTPEIHENTGDGGVGEATGTRAGKTVLIDTPDGQKNVKLNLVRPGIALLVRFGWTFFTTLSGSLGAGATGMIEMSLQSAALIALSTAALGALKDAAVVFNELKNKYPLLSGGI